MKNKEIWICYGIGAAQSLGIAFLCASIAAGTMLIAAGTGALLIQATMALLQAGKQKECPNCGAWIPKKDRICGECGFRYYEGVPEEKLTEYISREQETERSSEQIDCDFEQIETLAVEEMLACDGDIETFLKNRGKEDDFS